MLITCSFRDADKYDGQKYSIANSQPKPPRFAERRFLAPPWTLVCGYKYNMISEEEFAERYTEWLERMGPSWKADIEKEMGRAKTEDIVYMCWEPTGQFCHRHVLTEWLRKKYPDVPMLRR